MDILEKIIRENCWKFDKGYPDSQEDINYLKTLIEQQLDLFSPEELDDITIDIKKKTGVDIDKVDKDTKEEIFNIIGDTEISSEEAQRIKNLVTGFKFEKEFYNYTDSKGLSDKSSKAIFNKASTMEELLKLLWII